jgi:4'-phosphopantetheinyl transferase
MNSSLPGPMVAFPSLEEMAPVHNSDLHRLDDRTVHVWGLSLDGSASFLKACRAWLSEEERGRAARFVRREDRIRYIFAHGGLRAVLARYTGFAPAALRFQAGATGKPALLDEQGRRHAIRFNLSHSDGRMLIAVVRGQDVGVDLERMREQVDVVKLANRFYAPSEYQDILRGSSRSDQIEQFYRYWVAKEALLKGQGTGLWSLRWCRIQTQDNGASVPVRLSDGAGLQPGWTIRWLSCGAGRQGAVALYGNDWIVDVQTAQEA